MRPILPKSIPTAGTCALLALSLLASCDASDKDEETGQGIPGDADTDTDADTDSDTDADCVPLDPDPVPGPDCLSGTIGCGETITATTVGGSEAFDAARYEDAYCFIPYVSYDGAERVYAFVLQADSTASFVLDSPCADLDLVVMRWDEEASCPGSDHLISECQADDGKGGGSVENLWNSNDSRYLVIVDGKDEVEHNFSLSVSCASR